MLQAVMTKPGEIEFCTVAVPKIGIGEVLLHVKKIGVCGSDIHVYHGHHPFTTYPIVQGHEFSAVVEAVGENVTRLKRGMNVTARPQIVCGRCRQCRRGDYNICDVLKVQGFQAPGVAQEYFVTTEDKIVILSDTMTFEDGALVEPCAVAVHAVGKIPDLKGKNIVVLGAGTIGNLIAQVARASEAEKILIADLSDFRLDIACQCGITHTCNMGRESLEDASERIFGKDGFDVAFEAVGAERTMEAAINTIQKGGQIVVVGVFKQKPPMDMAVVGDRELSLIGTLMYKHADYEKAAELISSKLVLTTPIVSKHFAFKQYADAYKFIDEQCDKTMKVIIDL